MWNVIACPLPDCRGALRLESKAQNKKRANSTVTCRSCKAQYPMLAGVPILVPDPFAWMARFRESVLATLAEFSSASREAVGIVDRFAEQAPGTEAMRFGDDWVRREADDGVRVSSAGTIPGAIAGGDGVASTLRAMDRLTDEMMEMMPQLRSGVVVEVGCGRGPLSARLLRTVPQLVIGDLSLRAVLLTQRALKRVHGVVMDAEWLPLRPKRVRAIVAANVVDLLQDVSAFALGCHSALSRGGSLLVSTPDPDLGTGMSEFALQDLVCESGFTVNELRDHVPWVRDHNERHFEVYLAQIVGFAKS